MGYEQHIFRSKEDQQISYDECEEVVATDDSLTFSEGAENTIEWNGHPAGGIEGQTPVLFVGQGRISTREPDEFVTRKLFEIAQRMRASVGDDEGVFDDDHRQEIEASCKRILQRAERSVKKPKWKFW